MHSTVQLTGYVQAIGLLVLCAACCNSFLLVTTLFYLHCAVCDNAQGLHVSYTVQTSVRGPNLKGAEPGYSSAGS